jgi:prevent-host-death family protein
MMRISVEAGMTEMRSGHAVDVHELGSNVDKVLDDLRAEGHDVVITREGKPAAVIVDVERYREVQQALQEFSDPEYLAALLAARDEIRGGQGIPAEEVFAKSCARPDDFTDPASGIALLATVLREGRGR